MRIDNSTSFTGIATAVLTTADNVTYALTTATPKHIDKAISQQKLRLEKLYGYVSDSMNLTREQASGLTQLFKKHINDKIILPVPYSMLGQSPIEKTLKNNIKILTHVISSRPSGVPCIRLDKTSIATNFTYKDFSVSQFGPRLTIYYSE